MTTIFVPSSSQGSPNSSHNLSKLQAIQRELAFLKYVHPSRGSDPKLCYRLWNSNLTLDQLNQDVLCGVLPEEPNPSEVYTKSSFHIPNMSLLASNFPIPGDMFLYADRAPPAVQRQLAFQDPRIVHNFVSESEDEDDSSSCSGKTSQEDRLQAIKLATKSLPGLDSPVKFLILQFLAEDYDTLDAMSQVSHFWRELCRPFLRNRRAKILFADTFPVIDSTTSQASPALSSSGRVRFPQELVDMVIDNVSDDIDTLQNCSLVAKAWIYRSQYHLFRTIRVDSTHCPRLLVWFLTRSRHLRSHIHRAIISTDSFGDEFIDDALRLVGFSQISRVTIVQSQSTTFANWSPEVIEAFSDFIGAISNHLFELDIQGLFYFPSELVSRAKSLKHLCWKGNTRDIGLPMSLQETSSMADDESIEVLNLETATYMTDNGPDSGGSLFYPHVNLTRLDTLNVLATVPSFSLLQHRHLSVCSENLKHLNLEITSHSMAEMVVGGTLTEPRPPVSLSRLTNLKKLSVSATWLTRVSSSHIWDPICQLGACLALTLDTLPPVCPQLQFMTINLCVQNKVCQKNVASWSDVDKIINLERFPDLKEVVLAVCVECCDISVTEVNGHVAQLRMVLPRLGKMGGFKVMLQRCQTRLVDCKGRP